MTFCRKAAAVLLAAVLLLCSACSRRPEAVQVPAAEPIPTQTPLPEVPRETPVPAPTETAAPTATPTAEPTPEPTPAPPVQPGNYSYTDTEHGSWTLMLKESGIFSILHDGTLYNGEGWSDNGNGTVTTGPTEAAGTAPFFDEFGSSVWSISGSSCTPVI